MTYKAYMHNIEAKTGKSAEDFWELAKKNRLHKRRQNCSYSCAAFEMA